jgi:hypothetical protein
MQNALRQLADGIRLIAGGGIGRMKFKIHLADMQISKSGFTEQACK